MWDTEEDKITTVRKIRKGFLEEQPGWTLKMCKLGSMREGITVQRLRG